MDKMQIIKQVAGNVRTCQKCRLFQTAKNPVPGEGNINSEIIFIGEAPGQVEDDTGRPFVGRAGKLLESLLTEIGHDRGDVWIGNIIKHRPPDNRDPLPDEIAACEPYLALQIQTISPILIVTLGRFSMNYFYPEGKITRDRGNVIKIKNYNVYPVYHPAAALRNPDMFRVLKQDFLKIPDILEKIKNGSLNENPVREDSVADGQLGLGL